MTTNQPAPSGSARTEPDWTDQVTDLLVSTVDAVRDRTTGPILKIARGVVYGVVALLIGLLALGLVTIALVRVLSLLPGPQWIVYAVAGALFCMVGAFAWSKRGPVE